MSFRSYVLLILTLSPSSALACCAADERDVFVLVGLVALCVLLTPAFLIPFAGVLAIRPGLSKTRPILFAAYAVFGTALFIASIMSALSTLPATLLLVFAVLTITAPSFYYFFVAYRLAREQSKET